MPGDVTLGPSRQDVHPDTYLRTPEPQLQADPTHVSVWRCPHSGCGWIKAFPASRLSPILQPPFSPRPGEPLPRPPRSKQSLFPHSAEKDAPTPSFLRLKSGASWSPAPHPPHLRAMVHAAVYAVSVTFLFVVFLSGGGVGCGWERGAEWATLGSQKRYSANPIFDSLLLPLPPRQRLWGQQ